MKILSFKSLDSTNIYAREHFLELDDASLVTASEQTAGRGRMGRKWHSPAGENIYASFVMKNASNPFYATITASLAVLETLENILPEAGFFIKWPNDIYCGDSKICGVLSECVTTYKDGIPIRSVISGMGININMPEEEAALIDNKAVSLKILSGMDFNLKKIISRLAESLGKYYITYLKFPDLVFREWKDKNFILGRTVEIASSGGKSEKVFVKDITCDGLLVCRTESGMHSFSCGDIRIIKESLFSKEN